MEAGSKRAAGKDVLERDSDFQRRVLSAYRHLAAEGGWAVVDAEGEAEEVQQKVLAVVRGSLKTIDRRMTTGVL